MQKYLISLYQPDGPPPPPEVLEPIMRDMVALINEMKAAGILVFTGGLREVSEGVVVRVREGKTLTTDGPFTESKEHLGGFNIIEAPDRETALEWAKKVARVTTLPVEVRPFHEKCPSADAMK